MSPLPSWRGLFVLVTKMAGLAVYCHRLNNPGQTPWSFQPWVFYWLPKPNKPEGKEVLK
jgi:hypothetical protein